MSGPSGACPNCGAPIRFRWSSAVQTTCESCRSVVVRHDVNLEVRGEVSDIPLDSSPIQIGTTGRLDNQPFTVVGRIAYEYANGGWNEWHLAFGDGSSGWLSDAQLDYTATRLVRPTQPVPPAHSVRVGEYYTWGDRRLIVTTLTRARYVGVEGELPFEYWGKDEVLFVDLAGHAGEFATFDFSDTTPLLFVGRHVTFDEIALANVRVFDGW
ncbi:MAG: DUF4178 domain-containing protein [Vicinamibacterales bacterium]